MTKPLPHVIIVAVKKFFVAVGAALNLIYPRHCLACGRALTSSSKDPVCSLCEARIARHPKPYCAICGRTLHSEDGLCADCVRQRPAFTHARSACLYEGSTKELVHLFKYGKKRSLAATLARHMTDFLIEDNGITTQAELITFVPLHRQRLTRRGYNQSELLAAQVSKKLGIPLANCLEKSSVTRCQNELMREERLANLIGSFRTRRSARARVQGLSLLVIDDVMTTGATLNECSRVLLDAGAKEVYCLTLARGA